MLSIWIFIIVVLCVGFTLNYYFYIFFQKKYINSTNSFLKQIDLKLKNDIKEIFYEKHKNNKHFKISPYFRNLIITLIYYSLYLFAIIFINWAFSCTLLGYLISICSYSFYSLIYIVYSTYFIKFKNKKDLNSIKKDFEEIQKYFDVLKINSHMNSYEIIPLDLSDFSMRMKAKAIKRWVSKKTIKLQKKGVNANYIALYLIRRLPFSFIQEIKISNLGMYENDVVVNNDASFNYEIFIFKYILSKQISSDI